MIFSQQQVWQAVKSVSAILKLDAHLIMAINEQECQHPNGDLLQYDCSVARLEQGFYARYTRKFEFSTCVETLLACSYSTMQMMGESLRECKNEQGQNYFEWFFSNQAESMQRLYDKPLSPFCVIAALDYYCSDLNVSIWWGSRWFMSKLKLANGDANQALLRWNGGSNTAYPSEVNARKPRLSSCCV